MSTPDDELVFSIRVTADECEEAGQEGLARSLRDIAGRVEGRLRECLPVEFPPSIQRPPLDGCSLRVTFLRVERMAWGGAYRVNGEFVVTPDLSPEQLRRA